MGALPHESGLLESVEFVTDERQLLPNTAHTPKGPKATVLEGVRMLGGSLSQPTDSLTAGTSAQRVLGFAQEPKERLLATVDGV